MTTSATTHREMRTAARVGGIALLGVAVLAGLANFGVLENLITLGDAERTAQDIRDSEGLFRYAVAGLFLVAMLDVVVAWALLVYFRPVHEGVATLMAWLRAVHAGVFTIAISELAGALPLAGDAAQLSALGSGQSHAQALLKINTFYDIWDAALALFGVHLVLLGYLAYKSGYVPRAVGVLLVIAGPGYLADSLGKLLIAGYSLNAAEFTFVGELVLLIWLLVKGRSVTPNDRVPAAPVPGHG